MTAGRFIGVAHTCNRPDIETAQHGAIWECARCGQQWRAIKSSPLSDRPLPRDNFLFERSYRRALRHTEELNARIADEYVPWWSPFEGTVDEVQS